MKSLLSAVLFLLPLSLHAQDSLAGEWKVDPAQMDQVHRNIEPLIANVLSQANVQDATEKQKVRENLTHIFTSQRFAFTKSTTGAWEQEMEFNGKKVKFPVTLVPAGKGGTYQIHRGDKHTFTLSIFDADHLTLTSAKDRITFPMIRDSTAKKPAEPAAPAETPKP